MTIIFHPLFRKSFKRRIFNNLSLKKKTYKRIKIFQKNQSHPLLKNHALKGTEHNKRAFSITGDIRIVYHKISKNKVIFLDIGTHNQVY